MCMNILKWSVQSNLHFHDYSWMYQPGNWNIICANNIFSPHNLFSSLSVFGTPVIVKSKEYKAVEIVAHKLYAVHLYCSTDSIFFLMPSIKKRDFGFVLHYLGFSLYVDSLEAHSTSFVSPQPHRWAKVILILAVLEAAAIAYLILCFLIPRVYVVPCIFLIHLLYIHFERPATVYLVLQKSID